MSIRNYFPISVVAFILIVVGARYGSLPVLPFAVLTLVGETLLGFQLEDHKAPRFFGALWKAVKGGRGREPRNHQNA